MGSWGVFTRCLSGPSFRGQALGLRRELRRRVGRRPSGREGLPLLTGIVSGGRLPLGRKPLLGAIHHVPGLIWKLQNLDQACLPGDVPPLMEPAV